MWTNSSASSGDGASRSCINHLFVRDGHTGQARIGSYANHWGAATRSKGALQERAPRQPTAPSRMALNGRAPHFSQARRTAWLKERDEVVALIGARRPGGRASQSVPPCCPREALAGRTGTAPASYRRGRDACELLATEVSLESCESLKLSACPVVFIVKQHIIPAPINLGLFYFSMFYI